jgi:alpha-ketoglutarate-dependent taurine dioxygenase
VPALIEWVSNNRDLFESWLSKHGAVLLRGFAVNTPEEFEAVVRAVQPSLLNYIEGDSPRTKITGKVYTSTEYPETYQISLHNEISYAHQWPRKIFFYCAIPPAQGGETPIVDCREVLQVLDSQVRERFITRKVKYVNNLHGGGGVGKSWQDTFETNDKSEVVRYLSSGGVDFAWDDRGTLRTTQVRDAVIAHPVTGEAVLRYAEPVDDLNPVRLTVSGAPDDAAFVDEMRSALAAPASLLAHRWQPADIVIADNFALLHGRRAFTATTRRAIRRVNVL